LFSVHPNKKRTQTKTNKIIKILFIKIIPHN
jgi:hypothetical protein